MKDLVTITIGVSPIFYSVTNVMHGIAGKFDNIISWLGPNRMDQFIETQNVLNLTQEEIDSLNKLVSIQDTKSILNNFPNQKAIEYTGSRVLLYI